MRTLWGRAAGKRVLVSMPNVRQYGHCALEILQSFAEAAEHNASVFFVYPRKLSICALFELEPETVTVLRPNPVTALRLRWRIRHDEWREGMERKALLAAERVKDELRTELWRHMSRPGIHPTVRNDLKRLKSRLKRPFRFENWVSGLRVERQNYYRRRQLRYPVPVTLRPAALAAARAQAQALGLADDARIVTLHAREAGYKLGAEMQDTKPKTGRDDSVRNVRIDSYYLAMDYLVARGYTVVRIGDPSMTPVHRPGVIDLASSPHRSTLLELYCLLKSEFLIGSDSGPSVVAYLTNTPLVCTNCTEPVAAYPIRERSLYTVKGVIERETGRRLSLRDLLGPDYLTSFRNSRKYQYVDNTPEEIVEAVEEMIEMLAGRAPLTPAQIAFKEAVLEAEAALRQVSGYVRKWGADEGFMGDGRIGAGFADRYLESPVGTPSAALQGGV
ncbi:MAG: TIGR04372 family glycosyltransferase [Acidobacteriota bacterium]